MKRHGVKRLRYRSRLEYGILAFLALTATAGLLGARPASTRGQAIQIVSEEDSVLVAVPSRAIARGEKLSTVPLQSVRWPKSKIPPGSLLPQDASKSYFALTALPAQLPIPVAALSTGPIDANAVAESIPKGMRAITVRVDAESAVEGWARSGNFVDIILVRTSKESGLESLIIAENLKVLSAGASAQTAAGSETAAKAPNTITLLVSQEDALRVKTAATIGKLTFALRGTGDGNPTTAMALDQRRLLGPSPQQLTKVEFAGHARGPDGRSYVLTNDSKWMRASDGIASFQLDSTDGK